jgi:alpha-tubulin suppressor-like RCC1 family protein
MAIKNAIIYSGGGGGTDISDANAAVGDVLADKTFYAGAEPIKTGTMVDRGTVSTDITAVAQEVTIAAGKHSGSGVVKISATEQAKIIAGNIVDGVTILGVEGTAEAAPAAPTTGLFTWGNTVVGSGLTPNALQQAAAGNDWDWVSLGDAHGLGIKNGELYSWGNNTSGRTGQDTTSGFTLVPTKVGSFTDWYMCSAGYDHSLAIRKTANGENWDYTLWVFGGSGSYQLGNNSTATVSTPTQIGTDLDWIWCSGGDFWSCAIKGGKLYTCGTNLNFRTGQNSSTGNTTVWTNYDSESTGWNKCFAGQGHGLGIRSGELWGWGNNGQGRTGQNTTSGSTQIPTIIGSDTNWSSASAGNAHSAAIKTTGTLWTFGRGTNGRLGLNNTTSYSTPQQVGSDTDWQDVRCNGNSTTANFNEFTYAIKAGKLMATGLNNLGQIGQALTTAESLVFVQIGTAENYTKCAAGSGFGMAIRKTV